MEEQFIDLHTHSTISDGTLRPAEIVALAKETGLSAVALTDHDTAEGLPEFMAAGKALGLETVPGIEIAGWYGGSVEIHILGLYIDPAAPVMAEISEKRKAARLLRNQAMAEKLTGIGLPLTYEELLAEAGGSIITRAHYARLMVRKGYVKDRNEAFNKYISPGLPGYVAQQLLGPEECIRAILEAGGVPILAHPTLYRMGYKEITACCQNLMKLGLQGIEAMYTMYRHEQEREIKKIGRNLGLLYSGGSDFHGANKPGTQLGWGKGNLRIPYAYLEAIKNHLSIQ